MLPLISFETGRRKRTQSSDQDHSLILETANGSLVLFSNRNHGPRGQRSALKNPRVCTRAPPKRVGRAFCLLTKTYHGSRLTGHHLCGRPTFPVTSKHPYGDHEGQKQYETNPAENIATMAIDFRVL